ncbi:alpha-L-fucosidase [Paenibacillus roseipurpureus]|uniref:Alpha-L-fucosidase n=1 Tax=Paenibacillus roseopurpureus TaxID=2918901 RepID=A0AA96LV76_9BACL|nr:alpha-L-fucosidase [Paenibacillus sp. MBLB1832]WNR45250.1 alpha-L-fucosidase [Paenibacillus sp. MBLB1832]
MNKHSNNAVFRGKRGYLIDFHRGDFPEVHFRGFDREQYRELMKKAQIDNVMVYAKDHWGWSYYPTQVGAIHPKLEESDFDFIAEVKDVAESIGVDVCLYYSIDTDHWAATYHPEWRALDPYGNPVRAGSKWMRCSIAHEFGDYCLGQVSELLKRYKPKGLFFDCFPSVLCFCLDCQQRYEKLTGDKMPLGEQVHQQWRKLQLYEEEHYWLPFAQKLRHLFDTISPGTMLTTNGCNANMPRSVRELLDFHFAEPWAGNYLSAGFVRDVMTSAQIGPGDVGMVYDRTPTSYLLRELLSIGMQGARPFLYSESMRPDGSLEIHDWERMGVAYRQVSQVEPFWNEARPLVDINLLYSDSSHQFAPERNTFNQNWWERGSKHLTALQAGMTLAASMHRSYQIINGDEESFDPKHIIIVPNSQVLSLELWNKLKVYVNNGGTLLACLSAPPVDRDGNRLADNHLWEELFGAVFLEEDSRFSRNHVSSYLQVSVNSSLLADFAKHPLGVVGSRLIVQATKAEIWADLVEPIFEEDIQAEKWMAWRPPAPSDVEIGPAILHNQLGKGRTVLFTFDALSMSGANVPMETGLAIQSAQRWFWPKQMLARVVNALSRPQITVDGLPEQSYVTYMLQDGQLCVHILNDGDSPLVYGTKLRINCSLFSNITSADQLYPEVSALEIKAEGEDIVVNLPPQSLYNIYRILLS